MKIFTVVGARPQFIKSSVVSKAFSESEKIQEVLLHTGQHYDRNMSAVFFEQLSIPKPLYQLDINQGLHGQMTGRMLEQIEQALLIEMPDYLLVYGDTDSTLAGALAASKLNIPVVHVEAGLRSHNQSMPEEINRVLTDQLSTVLFCPSKKSIENLEEEGFFRKGIEVMNVGDVMYDCAQMFSDFAQKPRFLDKVANDFILATIHRQENTNNINKLSNIIAAFNYIHKKVLPVVMPIHPRTKKILEQNKVNVEFHCIEPVSYFEMVWLLKKTSNVMTDSGGLQKEAYFFNKRCITIRDETEWTELLDLGVNELVSTDSKTIIEVANKVYQAQPHSVAFAEPYGNGKAAQKIRKYFEDFL